MYHFLKLVCMIAIRCYFLLLRLYVSKRSLYQHFINWLTDSGRSSSLSSRGLLLIDYLLHLWDGLLHVYNLLKDERSHQFFASLIVIRSELSCLLPDPPENWQFVLKNVKFLAIFDSQMAIFRRVRYIGLHTNVSHYFHKVYLFPYTLLLSHTKTWSFIS